jgi:hypothetical protein
MGKKLNICLRRPKSEAPDLKELSPHDRAVARAALKAIATGLALEVEYSGSPRIVEVHAVGLSTAGKPCMRVYQLQGATNSGEDQGWKLMSLGKVFEMPKLMDIHSLAPREGYRKGDMAMARIFTEI